MKTLLTILTFVLVTGVAFADEAPVLEYDGLCSVRVTIETLPSAGEYYVCVTDGQYIGLHREDSDTECSTRIEIPSYNEWFGIEGYLVSCDIATDDDNTSLGTIKATYR